MEQFETMGMDGEPHRFQYRTDSDYCEGHKEVTFFVYTIPENSNRFFEYTFIFKDKNTIKGKSVSHHSIPDFSKKGLPEKIIQIASDLFDCEVYSSPFQNSNSDDYLIEASKKAWERLLKLDPYGEKDEVNKRYVLKKKPR